MQIYYKDMESIHLMLKKDSNLNRLIMMMLWCFMRLLHKSMLLGLVFFLKIKSLRLRKLRSGMAAIRYALLILEIIWLLGTNNSQGNLILQFLIIRRINLISYKLLRVLVYILIWEYILLFKVLLDSQMNHQVGILLFLP